MEVAVLHDEIARLQMDFLEFAVVAGLHQIALPLEHQCEVDAVGAVHSPAGMAGRDIVARPEVDLGKERSKIGRLVARLRGLMQRR